MNRPLSLWEKVGVRVIKGGFATPLFTDPVIVGYGTFSDFTSYLL
jgi:hypothetical protein